MRVAADDRTWPPGVSGFEDLLGKVLSATETEVKRRRGDEVVLSPCPLGACAGDKFSVNRTSGLWNCPKCGERGNAWQLVDRLGLGPVRQAHAVRRRTPRHASGKKRLTQAVVAGVYEEHRAELELSDAVRGEIQHRGLSMATARAWGLGAKGNAVVFPYRRSSGQIAFLKFKDVTTGKQWRWPPKDEMPLPVMEPLFARGDFSAFESSTITEGEWDAMSLWHVGHRNVSSLSGGAETWHDEWTTQLAPCPEVFLAYDQDEAGERGFRKALDRLGPEVVRRLTFAPHKDANDALRAGWSGTDFDRVYASAPRHPPAILRSLAELAATRVEQAKAGVRLEIIHTGHTEFDRTQRGLRQGELTVLTAHTGAGKTTFTLDLALRLAKRGTPVLYLSMEQGPESTVDQILGMVTCRAFEDMSDADMDRALAAVPGVFYVGLEPERDPVAQVRLAIRYAHIVHGVRFVVVDHLDYLIETVPGESRYAAASAAVKALQTAARDHEVHLVLICQPTTDSGRGKKKAAPPIRLADIAETRLARQLASNGWLWSSDKVQRTGQLHVAKARYGPAREAITIDFQFDGFRFRETGVRAGGTRR